jgi:hypothetical protein
MSRTGSSRLRPSTRVRADARQFVIVPGHEDQAVEVVIARRETYDLVRKRAGEAAELAEETDPRA